MALGVTDLEKSGVMDTLNVVLKYREDTQLVKERLAAIVKDSDA